MWPRNHQGQLMLGSNLGSGRDSGDCLQAGNIDNSEAMTSKSYTSKLVVASKKKKKATAAFFFFPCWGLRTWKTNMLVWDQTGAFKASWNGFGQHGSIRAESGHIETSKDVKEGVSLPSTSSPMIPLVLMKVTLYWDPTSHAGVIIHKDELSLVVSVAITVC